MQHELCERIAATLATAPIHDHLGYEALAYLKLPGRDYKAVLSALHLALSPRKYVEIGVRTGDTLRLAGPETHCIAIDPAPRLEFEPLNTMLAVSTSDAFFAHETNCERARGFDLAFIDGDHSAGQALRDFSNLERLAGPHSIICLHDVIPMDARTSTPECGTSFWTGDVWRLMAGAIRSRPDLVAFTVACPPTGLGIVAGFGHSGPALDVWMPTEPVDMAWNSLVRRLNIVPNSAPAILEALNRKRAA